ncbi:tripartite motif-containing protein 64-like [Eptesicus fuscus]|uniref:tripartite motif-containing protein 64-like n=1 Tax=Eptesicus fuscus TaxID=29078 RepID=UPI002403EB0B|nr:tripartite motif-containing protein 64-like [Eptesicus fuscus]
MESHTLQGLLRELTCSICMNYFLDPVTLDCGHSFCRPCLCLSWDAAQIPIRCPYCRQVSEKPDFKTSITLRRLASLARKARADSVNSSEEQFCVPHKAAKRLFCDIEKKLFCRHCSDSPNHVAHSHSPTQQAAEDYREELLKRMGSLWNMSQEMQNNVKIEDKKARSLQDYVALRKVMIRAEYQKIHQFLYEEERLYVNTMEREANEIFQQLQESKVRMTQQTESLKEMFREQMGMCHKPDVEMLQDLGTVLERTKLVRNQKPQPVNPDLTSWCCTGLLELLNKFRVDNVLSDGNISLFVCISEDVRSVLFPADHYNMSREPQRLRSFVIWGTHTFTSGRHYWEVDVPHSSCWILGVCKDILIMENLFFIDWEEASVLFSLKMNDHFYLYTNRPLIVHHVKMPVGKIGVFLDYDKGIVSFHNAGNGSLICSLVSSSFSSPLKPFLCLEAS